MKMRVSRTSGLRTPHTQFSLLGMVVPIICILRMSVREVRKQDLRKKTPLEWYRAELIKKPRDVGLWYAKGALLTKQGDHADAIECFKKVTEYDPDHYKGWSAQASAYYRIGDFDKSIEALDILLDMDEENETLWYQKGEAFLKQGKYIEANACYEKALDLEPNYVDAWCGKGNALKGIGKETPEGKETDEGEGSSRNDTFNNAMDCFKRVLDLHPDHYEAMGSKGSLLCEMGELTKGIEEIDRAVQGNPTLYEPMLHKAKALELQGMKNEAVLTYKEIVEHKPTGPGPSSVENLYWKGVAAGEIGQNQSALDTFNRILVRNPRHVNALVGKGSVLSQMRNPEQALEVYDKALAVSPNQGLVWYQKANTERDLGRLNEALVSYGKATTAEPHMKEAWYGRGLVNYAVENLRESLRDFLEVLEKDPSHMGANKMKSAIETRLNEQVDGALEVSLKTLERKGIIPTSTGGRGVIVGSSMSQGPTKEELVYNGIRLFSQERYQEALESFNQAIELDDQDYTLFEWMGDTLAKLVRYSEAIEWYDRAIKLKHSKKGGKPKVSGELQIPQIHGGQTGPIGGQVQTHTAQPRTIAAKGESPGPRGLPGQPEATGKSVRDIDDRDKAILGSLIEAPRTLQQIAGQQHARRATIYPRIEGLIERGCLERLWKIVTLERGTRRICLYKIVEHAYEGLDI